MVEGGLVMVESIWRGVPGHGGELLDNGEFAVALLGPWPANSGHEIAHNAIEEGAVPISRWR